MLCWQIKCNCSYHQESKINIYKRSTQRKSNCDCYGRCSCAPVLTQQISAAVKGVGKITS